MYLKLVTGGAHAQRNAALGQEERVIHSFVGSYSVPAAIYPQLCPNGKLR